jgi:hypothetical protein
MASIRSLLGELKQLATRIAPGLSAASPARSTPPPPHPAGGDPDTAGGACAVAALCVDPDSIHAKYQQHPQGVIGATGSDPLGRWQETGRVQAIQPGMGRTLRDFATCHRRPDRHGRSPLLRPFRSRLATHRCRRAQHLQRRSPGGFDPHPAACPQPLPGGDRPGPDADAQDQGGDHGIEDRGHPQQGRNPRNLPQHRALPLQRLRHRDGGTHLFRYLGRPTRCTAKRHAGRHAQGQQLLQPGAQSRAILAAPQHGAETDGQAREIDSGAIRRAQQEALAYRLRAANGTPGAGPAFRQVSAQVADRLGRPQRLQHLRRRAGGTHHHRFPATGGGQPGRDAPGQQLAEHRQCGLGKTLGVEHRLQPGAGLHPRIAGIRRRHRQGPDA